MLRKISAKRLAKGERLCWNSTIKAKAYTLKKSSLKTERLWREARTICFERYNHTCFICGSTKDLHCHHWKFTRSQRPDLKYNQDNLICLCKKCHNHNGVDEKFYEIKKMILNKIELSTAGRKIENTIS